MGREGVCFTLPRAVVGNTEKPGNLTSKTARNKRTTPESRPTPAIIFSLDANFPPLDAVVRASDGLLFPITPRAPEVTFAIFRKAEQQHVKLTTAGNIEWFVGALANSNKYNQSWTFDERQKALFQLSELPKDDTDSKFRNDGNLAVRLAEVLCATGNAEPRATAFSSVYMAAIGYLTSEAILKSPAQTNINTLYGIVDKNIERILVVIKTNFQACVEKNTFASTKYDYGLQSPGGVVKIVSGVQVFKPVATLLLEYLDRFREAPVIYRQVPRFIVWLTEYFEKWSTAVTKGTFKDTLSTRGKHEQTVILNRMRKDFATLAGAVASASPQPLSSLTSEPSLGVVAALQREYDGPGTLSISGARHSNDHTEIRRIKLVPTADEMTSQRSEYLPVHLAVAPHHLPADSMAKMLDVQFRLLREDAMGSIKSGVSAIFRDVAAEDFSDTQLAKSLNLKGGWYIDETEDINVNRLPMLTNLKFVGFEQAKFGLVVKVSADAPPGQARSRHVGVRQHFWEQSKRMPVDGLVAIVTKNKRGPPQVAMAILTSEKFSFPSPETFVFGLHFVDPKAGIAAARIYREHESPLFEMRFLVESPVMFESVRPFLQALQNTDPLQVPLTDYLVPSKLGNMDIGLPQYTQSPEFIWDLSVLLRDDATVDKVVFDPHDGTSISTARSLMAEHGKLDPSQSEAVIDSLTREISLIQGPPGTGKTFTGVELLRVLFANKIRPIMLLGFTNHALDHMLRATHDAGVTTNIVRLGTRSKDEVIRQYKLSEVQKARGSRGALDSFVGRRFRQMKVLEEEMGPVIRTLNTKGVDSQRLLQFLEKEYPKIFRALTQPPKYVAGWYQAEGGWQEVGKKGKKVTGRTLWDFWYKGKDLQYLKALDKKPPKPKPQPKPRVVNGKNRFTALFDAPSGEAKTSNARGQATQEHMVVDPDLAYLFEPDGSDDSDSDFSDDKSTVSSTKALPTLEEALQEKEAFLRFFGFESLPKVLTTSRPFQELLLDTNIWTFSPAERRSLADFLLAAAILKFEQEAGTNFERLERIIDSHEKARVMWNEAKDTVTVGLLDKIDLVGATTNGAAKLAKAMKGFAPKVIVLEEAGQILEAHVLSTLFPGVEHVIAIGDPLQLRPTVNQYELSIENPRRGDLFRFDVSLMERLSSGGLSMSPLQVQRRMRPPISSLVRNTLYPDLQDNDLVTKYPNVSGMAANLYFLDHQNREQHGGADGGSSKSNKYEAQMVCELALYLLKQGCYSKEGDIVILCGYLGQVLDVRKLLAGKVTVVIDERDEREIAKLGNDAILNDNEPDGKTVVAKQVALSDHILLRTVDNFQGEEAKVVILSLVRNSGGSEGFSRQMTGTIGFLRSRNRTNVAISRAKHGMYILGNANQLASGSPMWRTIIDELAEEDRIGRAFPVACAVHKSVRLVDTPGMLKRIAPEGGCLEPCATKLPNCDHICKRKCHPEDREHESVVCQKNCDRHHNSCGHRCLRRCGEDCGPCVVPLKNVVLPCGHEATVLCFEIENLSSVCCSVLISKQLPTCEHSALVECSNTTFEGVVCQAPCGGQLSCCTKTCESACGLCQEVTRYPHKASKPDGLITRSKHSQHPCGQLVQPCLHPCQEWCGTDHASHKMDCKAECLRVCEHRACSLPCSKPCSPCSQPCTWTCKHRKQICRLPCGMPCDLLPCDEPCGRVLDCGHPCPSICGEACEKQACPTCILSVPNDPRLDAMVDLVKKTAIRQIAKDPHSSVRFMTLDCGHIFTVESLDNHVELHNYYVQDTNGSWVDVKASNDVPQRPACPTCNSPITCPRYNRVIKRFLLDLQEQRAAKTLSSNLAAIANDRKKLKAIDKTEIQKHCKKIQKFGHVRWNPAKLRLFTPSDTKCTLSIVFECQKNNVFGMHGALAAVWRTLASDHLKLYSRLVAIANEKPQPHVAVYESAFATVYRQELDRAQAANDTVPSKTARLRSHARLGMTKPSVQEQSKLCALLETVSVRFEMFDLAASMSDTFWRLKEELKINPVDKEKRTGSARPRDLRDAAHVMEMLALGILFSCEREVKITQHLSAKADNVGWSLTAHTTFMSTAFRLTRYRTQCQLRKLCTRPPAETCALAKELADESRAKAREVEETTKAAMQVAIDGAMSVPANDHYKTIATLASLWNDFNTSLVNGDYDA